MMLSSNGGTALPYLCRFRGCQYWLSHFLSSNSIHQKYQVHHTQFLYSYVSARRKYLSHFPYRNHYSYHLCSVFSIIFKVSQTEMFMTCTSISLNKLHFTQNVYIEHSNTGIRRIPPSM